MAFDPINGHGSAFAINPYDDERGTRIAAPATFSPAGIGTPA